MEKHDFVVFSDLDGTLLDHNTYSFAPAKDALNRLKEAKIPLVLCSSKTRAEIELWRKRLRNEDPFISENGGALFFSDSQSLNLKSKNFVRKNNTLVMELGMPYPKLLSLFKSLKAEFGEKVRGFSEMGVEELAHLTGLPHEEALLARQREYTEPFVFDGNEIDIKHLERSIMSLNLLLTKGGRFFHLSGGNDKGKAVHIVTSIYKKGRPGLKTIGLGDSHNDLSLLQAVDIPVLVQKPGGVPYSQIYLSNLHLAAGEGPVGWNRAVLNILYDYI